ncbi:hypothetical protein DSO57_1005583 [Entomophthora muscae]|uniref:Uncharacterized protein n=1 Tax=Entomophthora muscae TaxID=34485 RepID=A0ACC2UGW0_9FUNG|nr:hypothetical protein DSO57_1005583 [Entomophthora muscae]
MRDNVRNLSQEELDRYVKAVNKLNSGTRPTRWDTYANKHIQYYTSVHWTPLFLAWHRLYLHSVERALQTIDPEVTIPYWDWSQYAQHPRLDPVLSNRLFGGSGSGHETSGCVTTGLFRNFNVFYWHDGGKSEHCLYRYTDIFQRPFTSATVIDHNYLSEPTFKGFAEAIEALPHATAHNNIGGEFSGYASPGDPLFYSHHAFVDKLWFDWQNRHPDNYYDYSLDENLNVAPWNMKISDATNPIYNLCYFYPQEHFRYANTNPLLRSLQQSPYSPPVNATDDQLMAHARQFIRKGIKTNLTIPDPLPVKMIRDMGYDLVTIRNLERRDALTLAKFDTNLI